MHNNLRSHEVSPIPSRGNLQTHPLVPHAVVVAHYPLVLQTQYVIKSHTEQRHKSRAFLLCGYDKTPVEIRQGMDFSGFLRGIPMPF